MRLITVLALFVTSICAVSGIAQSVAPDVAAAGRQFVERLSRGEYAALESQFTDAMKAVLNDAKEIICVGTSSEELPVGVSAQDGSASEEWRAARRAEQIAVWVRASLEKPVPVRKLNAGYHVATAQKRAADTSDQRRVVIILVLDHDEGTNIDEALRSAMLKEHDRAPIFETLLTRYSLAKGPAFSWVP